MLVSLARVVLKAMFLASSLHQQLAPSRRHFLRGLLDQDVFHVTLEVVYLSAMQPLQNEHQVSPHHHVPMINHFSCRHSLVVPLRRDLSRHFDFQVLRDQILLVLLKRHVLYLVHHLARSSQL